MRVAWIVVASCVAYCLPAAGAQELRGILVLDGHPGYLTNPYLDPSFGTWTRSIESAFGTGGASGLLEWTGERLSVRSSASVRALGHADSASVWRSARFGAGVEWRPADRLGVGVDGSYAASERPDSRRTLWGRASLRWNASSRVRLTVGPAIGRTRLPVGASSEGPALPGLPTPGPPIPGGTGTPLEATADAAMALAALDVWPARRWQVGAEMFAVRTDAEDLGLEYAGGGGMLRVTRWFADGASVSAGLGGEGFGYRAALDEADGPGVIPDDDFIWRGELDGRWPLADRLDLVARLAALHRSTSGSDPGFEHSGFDYYGSLGLRLTLGGRLAAADPGAGLWSPEPAGMRIRVPYGGDGRLYLTGDFNAWAEPGLPLRRAADGAHVATIRLEPGIYRYRVRVVEETTDGWLDLPPGAATEDDGFGGTNGLLIVTGGER